MGKKLYKGSFFDHFMIIYDPRQEGKVRHKLIDVLFIAVAASICYCNEWLDMEDWAIENEDWLKQYLELPNGIPSWYTIERVFDIIDPKQFEMCFMEWMREITNIKKGSVVAIDGKTMRGTIDKESGKKAIHIVSAWCSENKLVMGQVKTDEKSNEITAIPELLDMLFIKGAIVTIDAMGCQKDIAKKIVKDAKADYVLSLKENHPLLYEEVEAYFKDVEKSGFNDKNIGALRTIEKGHGRIEERLYYYSTDTSWMNVQKDWEKLKGIGMVIRRCEIKGRVTEERAYHLASVNAVEDYARGVRLHWGVESMHWSLDVTFREDANRTRTGKAPQNLAMLKRLAMNMVKKDQERYPKRSLRSRRFLASLKKDYLEYIFRINFR
ncbi:MAG: ISAs1 family transposase [Xylanivirga thermophila]|jgi:predicted transposase YbfD/YdcC|uniref:ISAs1 family transposase n=1 Tax=Xylanivirga thermophila TaxID=2496273 RepID=UPI0039F5BB32